MGWQNIVYKIVFNDNRNEIILINTNGKEDHKIIRDVCVYEMAKKSRTTSDT
ncbi:hypothetical protein BH23THE1_BH23THE1_23660 [soil metagenome]